MDPLEPDPHPTLSSDDEEPELLIAELRISMTVILARAQMLRRRIRRGRELDAEDCIPTLGHITGAVHAMEARLRAIERQYRQTVAMALTTRRRTGHRHRWSPAAWLNTGGRMPTSQNISSS